MANKIHYQVKIIVKNWSALKISLLGILSQNLK